MACADETDGSCISKSHKKPDSAPGVLNVVFSITVPISNCLCHSAPSIQLAYTVIFSTHS